MFDALVHFFGAGKVSRQTRSHMPVRTRTRLHSVRCEAFSRLGLVSITPGQGVRHAAQESFFLDLLPVSLPLCLPGVSLCLVGPRRLGRFLLGFGLPLLRPAFLLLGLVAGQGAPGFFGLARGFVVHVYSLPFRSAVFDYWFEALITSLTVMRP